MNDTDKTYTVTLNVQQLRTVMAALRVYETTLLDRETKDEDLTDTFWKFSDAMERCRNDNDSFD